MTASQAQKQTEQRQNPIYPQQNNQNQFQLVKTTKSEI